MTSNFIIKSYCITVGAYKSYSNLFELNIVFNTCIITMGNFVA